MTRPETDRYYTPKLSLLAPSLDDEISACRANWDRLDNAYSGVLWVTPGTVPDASILYDGCIVAEKGTGIVWRAQKNASGVFEKRYIKYPWRVSFYQGANAVIAASGAAFDYGYDTVEGGTINAGNADLVNNRLVIPITGIYQGSDWIKWNDSAANTGWRSHSLSVNAVAGNEFDEDLKKPTSVSNTCFTLVPINRRFGAGDTICAKVWQDSAIQIPTLHRLQLSLVRVVY